MAVAVAWGTPIQPRWVVVSWLTLTQNIGSSDCDVRSCTGGRASAAGSVL